MCGDGTTLGELKTDVVACFGKGVRRMGGLGEAIERRAFARGVAKGEAEGKAESVITCMNAHGCGVEEALAVIGYDRSEWPTITEAVEELLAKSGE